MRTPRDDLGMVSVEAAIATGSLVAVLALALAAMSAMVLQLRCVDAAAEAARLSSRGDVDTARRAAARLVPDGAAIVVDVHGEEVVVRVEASPVGSALPGLHVGARATAAREPDTVAAGEPGADATPDVADVNTADVPGPIRSPPAVATPTRRPP